MLNANLGRNLPVLNSNFACQAKTRNRQITNVNGKQPVSRLVLGPFLENRNNKRTWKTAVVSSHSRASFQ